MPATIVGLTDDFVYLEDSPTQINRSGNIVESPVGTLEPSIDFEAARNIPQSEIELIPEGEKAEEKRGVAKIFGDFDEVDLDLRGKLRDDLEVLKKEGSTLQEVFSLVDSLDEIEDKTKAKKLVEEIYGNTA